MTAHAETPAQGALRVLAITGLLLTGSWAGLLFLAGWWFSIDRDAQEYLGEPSADLPLLMLGYGGSFVGACVATFGLVKRLPLFAFVGAAGLASGAILAQATLEARDSDSGYLIDDRLMFAVAILVDVAVVVSAWHIHRRSRLEFDDDA